MADRQGPPPRRVLISCLRLLGDVVLSLPLLDMVKAEHPNCEVDYLVPAGMGDFLKCDPRVRRVIEHVRGGPSYLPRILGRYDWAFSTNGSDRGVISVTVAGSRKRLALVDTRLPFLKRWKQFALTHAVPMPQQRPVISWCTALARAAGLNPVRCHAEVYRNPSHESMVDRFLGRAGALARPYLVVHPFSRYAYKQWDMERVARASDAIAERHGLVPIWTGSGAASERTQIEAVAARTRHRPVLCLGDLDLNALTCLIARSRLYIGMDTAITHLAATTLTPIVALYGPTPTVYWSPWNNRSPVDQAFPTSPGSFRNGHISVLQDAEAFQREHSPDMAMDRPSQAMAAITVEQVVAEADHLLATPFLHLTP